MSFIVIEGLDGSGKSTQVNKLKKYFTDNNIEFEFLHFPETDSKVFGELIAKFLRGDLGSIQEVNPYLVALLYAGDRNNAAKKIRKWLEEGKLVLTDRYVYSNIAYQCAKVSSQTEKDKLYNWIFDIEYNFYKIPKPDLSMFLKVPFSFTKRSLTQNRKGDDRSYLNGKEDIHEASLEFQEKVRETYIKALEKDEYFMEVDCASKDNKMLCPDVIFYKIINELKNQNIL